MPGNAAPGRERVRTAEVIAALSLATDLGIGVPLEHGLDSTVVAMRRSERLGSTRRPRPRPTMRACCSTSAAPPPPRSPPDLFGDETALTRYATPARFGSRPQMVAGMLRAVAPPGGTPLVRALQLARGLPRLARELEGRGGHHLRGGTDAVGPARSPRHPCQGCSLTSASAGTAGASRAVPGVRSRRCACGSCMWRGTPPSSGCWAIARPQPAWCASAQGRVRPGDRHAACG